MTDEEIAQLKQKIKTQVEKHLGQPVEEIKPTWEESIRNIARGFCESQVDKIVSPFELDKEASKPAEGLLVFKRKDNSAELN